MENSIDLIKKRYAELADLYDDISKSKYHQLIGEELSFLIKLKAQIQGEQKPEPLSEKDLEVISVVTRIVKGTVDHMKPSIRKPFLAEIIKQLNS
jgi:hypothetical protein